jgi:hypothetical protein
MALRERLSDCSGTAAACQRTCHPARSAVVMEGGEQWGAGNARRCCHSSAAAGQREAAQTSQRRERR